MSEKTNKIRGLLDSAESLHVEIVNFVRIADVSCVNGATTMLKVTLEMCANLPILGPQMPPQVKNAISTFYAAKWINFMQHMPTANIKTTGEKIELNRVCA